MFRKQVEIKIEGVTLIVKELTPVHVGKFLERYDKLDLDKAEMNLAQMKELIFDVAPDCIEGISKEELLNCGLSTVEKLIKPFQEVNKVFFARLSKLQEKVQLSPTKTDGNPIVQE